MLDSHPLSVQTKAVAQATYLKKKMYYNMRINTLRRKAADLAQQAQQGLQVLLSNPGLHAGACLVTPSVSSISPATVHCTVLPTEYPDVGSLSFLQGLALSSCSVLACADLTHHVCR